MIKLTIAIPTFNRSHRLDDQLNNLSKSISPEQLNLCEIILSNNASTDNTSDVCKTWQIHFEKKIKIFHQSHNIGLAANFSFCLKQATGDYVWVIGDDDPIHHDTVSNIIKVITSYKELGLIHLNYTCIDSRDQSVIHQSIYPWTDDIYSQSGFSLVEQYITSSEFAIWLISANIVNRELALDSLKYWEESHYNPQSLALPIFVFIYSAINLPGYFISSSSLNCTYNNASWMTSNMTKKRLSFEYYEISKLYIDLIKLGFKPKYMNSMILRKFRPSKNLLKFAFLCPKLFFYSLLLLFGLCIKNDI